MTELVLNPVAAVPYVVISEDGDHYLAGSKCGNCGATLLGLRPACARCGDETQIEPIRLADTGRIRTCSVISRSYPGVPVPFIAAVIDIDGGGVIRGTLNGPIPEDPVAQVGKPVQIQIGDTGQRDASGRPYFSHNFRPAEISV